jgi:hypothetical protein
MTITAYQTLEDRNNRDEVETEGPFICTRTDAWLGTGYYFWDSDIHWAHDWGKKSRKRYLICGAQIDIDDNTLDLIGNIAQKLEFAEIMKALKEKDAENEDYVVTVPKVLEYMKKFQNFKYNSIRAADYPKASETITFGGRYGEYMYLYERVQVCLINKNNLILQSFRVIYPGI